MFEVLRNFRIRYTAGKAVVTCVWCSHDVMSTVCAPGMFTLLEDAVVVALEHAVRVHGDCEHPGVFATSGRQAEYCPRCRNYIPVSFL